jgi:hypothetical protein
MPDPQDKSDSTSGAVPPAPASKMPARKAAPRKAPAVPAKKVPAKKIPAKKAPTKAAGKSARQAEPGSRPPTTRTAAAPGQAGEAVVGGIPTVPAVDAPAGRDSAPRPRSPVRIPLTIGLAAASLGAMVIRRLRRH